MWPITSTTFIPVHKAQKKPEQGAEVLKFFDWAYKMALSRRMIWTTPACRITLLSRFVPPEDQYKDSNGKALY